MLDCSEMMYIMLKFTKPSWLAPMKTDYAQDLGFPPPISAVLEKSAFSSSEINSI